MNTFRAFRTGFLDGWEQGDELSMGMTYEDSDWLQRVYDQGTIIGAAARRYFK